MKLQLLTAEQIKQRREAVGMSQSELARQIGVARTSVWRWEVGEAHPLPMAERELLRVLREAEARYAGNAPAN